MLQKGVDPGTFTVNSVSVDLSTANAPTALQPVTSASLPVEPASSLDMPIAAPLDLRSISSVAQFPAPERSTSIWLLGRVPKFDEPCNQVFLSSVLIGRKAPIKDRNSASFLPQQEEQQPELLWFSAKESYDGSARADREVQRQAWVYAQAQLSAGRDVMLKLPLSAVSRYPKWLHHHVLDTRFCFFTNVQLAGDLTTDDGIASAYMSSRIASAYTSLRQQQKTKPQAPASAVSVHTAGSKKKVSFENDENLGDHTSNSDLPYRKPNYAAAAKKARQPLEEVFDDCGDDTASSLLSDTEPTAEEHFVTQLNTESTTDPPESQFFDSAFFNFGLHGAEGSELSDPACPHFETVSSFSTFVATLRTARLALVELFGGHGGVTRVALRRGLKCGRNHDLTCSVDLSVPSERTKFLQWLRQEKPFCVVMGPPCTAFGPWSYLNEWRAPLSWARAVAVGLPLAELACQAAEIQSQNGLHWLIENPWSSRMWQLPCFLSGCNSGLPPLK